MTDMQQICNVLALLNSGAMGLFIDVTYVEQHHLTTCPLTHPIPVYNIDSTCNKAGSICSVIDLVLRYCSHAEHAVCAVTSLGKQDMILGFTWLCEHNPKIDWVKGEVSMS